jgi:hypothetical protein
MKLLFEQFVWEKAGSEFDGRNWKWEKSLTVMHRGKRLTLQSATLELKNFKIEKVKTWKSTFSSEWKRFKNASSDFEMFISFKFLNKSFTMKHSIIRNLKWSELILKIYAVF